ncbi:MAG: hypothetical protein Fues2KO_52100 [Fuerstiella sp.]
MTTETTTAANLDEVAEALELSRAELDRIRKAGYFPPKEEVYDGKEWNVDAIREYIQEKAGTETKDDPLAMPAFVTARDDDGNSLLIVKNESARFDPRCPNDDFDGKNGKPHKVIVGRTAGRLRFCACDTCGTTFKAVGEYSDIRLETLRRIRSLFAEAQVGEHNGKKFVVFTSEASEHVIKTIERVMKRADSQQSLTRQERDDGGRFR